MAVDKKISQLTSLAQVDVSASTDVLPIVDTSATETKKITVSALVGAGATAGISGAVLTNGTINSTTIGATTPSTGAFTTLSASGNFTLSGGTANGVLYLDGSKVATSGSALYFDGTNLGVGTTSPTAVDGNTNTKLTVGDGSTNDGALGAITVQRKATSTSQSVGTFQFANTQISATEKRIAFITGATGSATNSGTLQFWTANAGTLAEAGRFDSSGNLGIGTASPAAKLDIGSGNLTFSSTAQRITGDMSNATIANRLAFQTSTTNGATRLNLLPNGTAVATEYLVFNSSDPANSSFGSIRINASDLAMQSGQNGTGTYLPMTFYTGGSERMRLDTSGNLGIGTASPSTKLHVFNGAITTQQFGAASLVDFYCAEGTSASPTALISGRQFGALRGYGYDGSSYILASSIDMQAESAWSVGTTPSYLRFRTTATGGGITERMRIDSSGNVGIGVTPTVNLDVKNAGGNCTISAQYGTGTKGQLIAASNEVQLKAFNGTNDVLTFATGASERMRIDSSGNVGIGTASPGTKLTVSSATNAGISVTDGTVTTIMYNSTGGVASIGTTSNHPVDFYANNAAKMRITSGGEVYIAGTTDQGAYNLQCNGTGVWGAGAYVNGSDARLKDNIQSLDSGLDVVKAMRPVTFQYKPEYSKDQSVQPGFIAQELQEAMAGKPYLDGVVQEGPNHLNVAYQSIIPILVKAIQELEAKVAALEAK